MKNRTVVHKEEPLEQVPPSSSALPEMAVFLLTALVIIFFGLIVLYSTSFAVRGASLFTKQLMWMCIGVFGFSGAVLIGYKNLADFSPLMVIGIIMMLVACLFFPPINGAQRWIKAGSFSIQPSEYAKVILVLFVSWFLAKRGREMEQHPFTKVLIPCSIAAGAMIFMVLCGRDLGTTVLLGTVYAALFFAAGFPWIWIVLAMIAAPTALFFLIKNFDAERMARMTTFLNPEIVQADEGYQLWNSFLALGSGGWFGVGFTESRLKLKYLPESHTDFILAIVGEELGYVGILAVITAYVILVITGLRISFKARTRLGMFIAFGMVSFIALQAIINIGVICGGFPTKGMPAPMISYGGSNLVACMAAAGCVVSVALDNAFPDYQNTLFANIKAFFRKLFFIPEKKIQTVEDDSQK